MVDKSTPWSPENTAKLVLVTENLNEEQFIAVIDVLIASLPEVGWTVHKVIGEDIPDSRDGHLLKVSFAESGNPPKKDSDGN